MDGRAIGVFDSGLGGLTAVKRLMEVLPGEDIVYLGDTGRVPYGTRSKETILKYARQDIAFLLRYNIKAVVVACGTVSTNALDEISGEYDIPILGIVDATAEAAVKATKNGRIGIIGTNATIRSGAFRKKLLSLMPEAEIFEKACPLFVPLVENGRISPDDVVLKTVAEEYLSGIKEGDADTLILGCTHYPIIEKTIAGIMGDGVTLIDSGAETAGRLAAYLAENGILNGREGRGSYNYYISDSPAGFESQARLFLGADSDCTAEQISLEDL